MKKSKSKELKEFRKLHIEMERLARIKVKAGMSKSDILKEASCDRLSECGKMYNELTKLINWCASNEYYKPLGKHSVASLMESLRDYDFSYHKVEDFLDDFAYCYGDRGKASAIFAYCSSELEDMIDELPCRFTTFYNI